MSAHSPGEVTPLQEKLETIAERSWRAYPEMRGFLTDDWSMVANKHRDAHRQRVAELTQAQGGLDALLPHIEARERKNAEAEAERQATVAAQPTPPPDAGAGSSAPKVADNAAQPVAGTPNAAACPIDFLQAVFFDGGVTDGNIHVTIANTVSFERRDRTVIAQEIAECMEGPKAKCACPCRRGRRSCRSGSNLPSRCKFRTRRVCQRHR